MNGARTTFMRRGYLLTALSALLLLAASAGTASAQGTISNVRVSLDSDTVNEGGTATATATFTVTATASTTDTPTNGVGAGQVTVGFGFHTTGLGTSQRATDAVDSDFIGLTTQTSANTQFVRIGALREGRTRNYSVTHEFGLNNDLDAEDGQFKLTVDVSGLTATNSENGDVGIADPPAAPDAKTYIIKDDETQTYTLSLVGNPKATIDEGSAAASVQLTADPRRTTAETVPDFTVVGPQGFWASTANQDAIETGIATTGNQGAPASVPVGNVSTTTSADKNRTDDTMTLQLYAGGVGNSRVVHELDVTVVDVEKLPAAGDITAEAHDDDGKKVTEIVEGGDPVYLTISVDRNRNVPTSKTTEETLAVAIRSGAAQAGDYEVEIEGGSITLNEADESSDVDIKLWALEDEDVGAEDLELHLVVAGLPTANLPGSSTGTFKIAVVDKTTKQIEPKSEDDAYPAIMTAMEEGAGDQGFNPGESFSVMVSDLFDVADGYTAAYAVSVEGGSVSASASGESVKINAEEAGTSKVTVTATAKAASSSFAPSQTVSNIAEIAFEVEVVDTALKVTVAADPAEIDEGGTSEITATANRAVVAGDGEVVVDLEVVGGGNAELDADSIMIAEGEMSGSVMLTAGEDDDYEDETVTVLASGSGINGNMQVNIAVTDTDMAPDALVVTLHAPEDVMEGNIVEGMSYDIMATANRAVTDDEGEVEVMIMRDRSKSDADDDDFEVTSATIMAGEDSATATLMVTEDNMPDAGHAMGEVLVLYGESDHAEVEGELMFTIWDEAVPALPLIAQLLLALFLMAGGARLYRRRQS